MRMTVLQFEKEKTKKQQLLQKLEPVDFYSHFIS